MSALRQAPTRQDFGSLAHGEILSSRQFHARLHVEKRRADRIKSPLSFVMIRLGSEAGFAAVEELLITLGRSKRETDILGYISDTRVALLLPHTSEEGARVFVDSVTKQIAHLNLTVTSATYPDYVFDSMLDGERDVSDAVAYFFDENHEASKSYSFFKRALDVTGSLAGLVVLSPVMVLTALVVALTSPGPIIFRQPRIGKGGVPFTFLKFRSMRVDADDRIHREYVANLIKGNLDEINQGDKDRPVYKMSADPRITPVGAFIRKTSIDELPQLFNVLKGDMSLVGPRPPLLYEAEKYQSWHLRRVLEIRPGLTGLWQVEGRSKTSFDDMVRLDLRYIRSRSLWLDAKILLKTVKVVLWRDGAG